MITEKTLNRIGLVSLAFGGFLLLTYAASVYFAVWRGEFLPFMPGQRRLSLSTSPLGVLLSPFEFIILLCGAGFAANGYVLLRYASQKEVGDARQSTVLSLLTEEEKKAFSIIQSKGSLTQKELSVLLEFSAVKTHRVLSRLEEKNLVKTYPFGMTKKILLPQ